MRIVCLPALANSFIPVVIKTFRQFSPGVGLLAGTMFGAPLPFTVSIFATAACLGLVLVIAMAASAAPASRAARLSVREALAYE